MNHIYKTILNKDTGEISVVSENTSSNYQSQRSKTLAISQCGSMNIKNTTQPCKKKALAIMVGLALTTCLSSMSYAQDYTGNEPLSLASDIDSGFENLLGGGAKEGVIIIDDGGVPNTENTELNINYAIGPTPEFVVAGYVDLSNLTEDEANTNNNIINLKSGNIDGDVYAGLAHVTKLSSRSVCSSGICPQEVDLEANGKQITSSNNTVNVLSERAITGQGSIFSGYVGTNFKVDSLKFPSVDTDVFVTMRISDNNYETISNNINILGSNNVFNDLNAGYAAFDLQSGDLSLEEERVGLRGGVELEVASNTFNTSENVIRVQGESNRFDDLKSGYVLSSINSGDFKIGLSDPDLLFNATINMLTIDNTFSANKNKTIVLGNSNQFNNLKVGQAGLDIQSGQLASVDLQHGMNAGVRLSAITNVFGSNENTISIQGENNKFKHILAGYAGFSVDFSDISSGSSTIHMAETTATAMLNDNMFDAIENSVELNVNNTTISDLTTGYAGINIQFGDQNGGNEGIDEISTVDTTITTNANILNANKNKIILSGDTNNIADVLTGSAGVKIQSGSIGSAGKAANIDAGVSANANIVEANENNINISGHNNSFNNLTAGSAGIDIQVGHLNAGTANFSDNVSADAGAMIMSNSNSLNADQNNINIKGENNKFNHITAGYAGFKINVGGVTGGKTIANGAESYGDAIIEVIGENTTLSAKNNQINLIGSSVINGNVHTGYIDFNIEHGLAKKADGADGELTVYLDGSEAYATDNTITIEGQHSFTNKDSTIYGGYLAYNKDLGYKPEIYDVFTGNTLNYANRTPISIKEIGNFQTYNFTLSPELGNTGTALIHAGIVNLGANSDNISDGSTTASDVYVTGIHSGKVISTSTEFILMKGDNLEGEGTGYITNDVKQVQQGISLLYDVETKVDKANNQVTATILAGHEPDNPGPTVNPQLKSLLEGNLSGLMLLTRSADNIAYNTFSAITEQNRHKGLVPFVQMSGHHARYNSGSHIDANGGLLTAGISFQNDNLTLAAFSENGWADYDSNNTFLDAAKVDATGDNRFNGGGIYGQYDFKNGLYTDASVRGGRLHTSYKTDDIRNAATGEAASYKVSGNYLSAHIGGGYQFQINALNHYDLNLKYLWTGTAAQDLTVAGDEVHFDKLNSHRLRLNGENSYQFNPDWSLLVGTGFEYEFDGKAEGTTYRIYSIDAPSVQGVTAIGTLGIRYQPVSNKNLTIDFKGNGYLGERDGGSATLHMQYAF